MDIKIISFRKCLNPGYVMIQYESNGKRYWRTRSKYHADARFVRFMLGAGE